MVLKGDGGGGLLGPDGQPVFYGLQGGEKTYADFEIAFTSPGGHSSAPTGDNAIQHLSAALQRVGAYDFPPLSNELTRASLMAESEQVGGEMRSEEHTPELQSLMRISYADVGLKNKQK